ncbi:Lar family restriction alleviation protein [Enterobacter sp. A103]|uniref:Lar family restriction alleviation protein n=1 Tax=Enterobacter sp. A103 TaxID=3102785 RepID=UPI002ACAA52C|nr:Lar family restriction alleviation protein [Enterobacter sp. A103]MDZ5639024.1 Lar family restriction alleviation protein [Enterobacter sp. A103]
MKLLPCPFCGGEPEEDGGMFFEFYGHERQDYSITCKKCGAEVRCDVGEHEGADAPCSCHHDTRKICAEKWNSRAAMLQGADVNSPVIPDDVRRMDWLVSKTVDVREPMVYGSHSLFWSQTITDEEDDYHATKLREQIDAAMEAEQAAEPKREV